MIGNLLYILQSENYDIRRFIKYSYSHWPWWRWQKRQKLVWTYKVVVLYLISWFLWLTLVFLAWYFYAWPGVLICLMIAYLLSPVLIVIGLILTWPIDSIFKLWIVGNGSKILEQKKIIKIGITGSYGKTTMKEILGSILSKKYRVLWTPENVNTDVGVARFVSKSISDEEVFIVEMGAYCKQDIVNLCNLVKPDYSILTGITSAHLDRFGSMKQIVDAKYELSRRTTDFSILNFDDDYVKENAKIFGSKKTLGVDTNHVTDIEYLDDFGGINFRYRNELYSTKLPARHNIVLILMAIELALKLGMNNEQIKAGIADIEPIKHRLQPIFHREVDMWVLDDSYNANVNGVKSGIEVLSRAGGRKIVLTPGPLVELGKESEDVHRAIGNLYAKHVDLVLLIKSKQTDAVVLGLREKGFTNYRMFKSTVEAHQALPNIIKKGDTVLLQNDWPDVYF